MRRPQITFERAWPRLLGYLMRDTERLKNEEGAGAPVLKCSAYPSGDTISRDTYCKWTRTECGTRCRKKGRVAFIRKRNGIRLQSYSSSPRCATLTTDSSEGYLTRITPYNNTVCNVKPQIIKSSHQPPERWFLLVQCYVSDRNKRSRVTEVTDDNVCGLSLIPRFLLLTRFNTLKNKMDIIFNIPQLTQAQTIICWLVFVYCFAWF